MTHIDTDQTDDIPPVPGHMVYGTAPQARIPTSMVAAGFYDACPSSLRPDGSRARHLFDMGQEEGRAAHAAYVADRENIEALKDAAYARHLAAHGAGENLDGMGI